MFSALKCWRESLDGRTGWGANPASLPGSPVLGQDYILVQMLDNNNFTMRQTPRNVKWLRSAGVNNYRYQRIATQYAYTGQLTTALYPSQAAFWAGVLQPNATTNDLPSMVVDWQHVLDDNAATIAYHRFLGVKIQQAVISGNADDQVYQLTLNLVGKSYASPDIGSSDFGVPATSAYPSEIPYCFVHTSNPGYLNILGSSRSEYSSFELTIDYNLDFTFNETAVITRSRLKGRTCSWKDRFIYTSNQDRINFDSATQLTGCSCRIDNGTNHVIFDFKNANFIGAIDDDIPLDKNASQVVTFENALDLTAGTDLAITVV